MGCYGCGRSTKVKSKPRDILGSYKYLSAKQIKARLDVFKEKNCTNCEDTLKCDFTMYKACTKKEIK
jgi:hypothetical protein